MSDNDFSRTMEELESEGCIEFERTDRLEQLPLTEEDFDSPTGTSTRYKKLQNDMKYM